MSNQLPPGFVLDTNQNQPQLPAGFQLDTPGQQAPPQQPVITPPPAPYQPGQTGSIADPALQGLSFGWGDELAGVLGAAYGTLMPESLGGLPAGVGFGEAYEGITGIARQQAEDFAARNPKTALAAEIGAGLGVGLPGLAKGAAKASPAIANFVQRLGVLGPKGAERVGRLTGAGMVGGLEGAVAGAGTAEEGERLKGAQVGALIGVPLGVVGNELINSFTKSTEAKTDMIRKLQDTPYAAETVGKQLRNLADKGATGKDLAVIGEEMAELEQITQRTVKDNISDFFARLGGNTQRVVDDPLEQEALRQGWSAGFLGSLRKMSANDRKKAIQMVQRARAKNVDAFQHRMDRPSEIAGQSFGNQVRAIQDLNKNAAQNLRRVARDLKGVDVNFDSVVDDFIEDLDDMGISLGVADDNLGWVPMNRIGDTFADPRGALKQLKANFDGSDIEGLKGIEDAVNRIITRMRSGETVDGYDLHRLKQYIDENVGYGKKSAEGLSGKTETKFKKLRSGINKLLREASPEYKAVNEQFMLSRKALDNLNDATPGKLDLKPEKLGIDDEYFDSDIYKKSVDKVLGQELRKLFTRYSSNQPLSNSVDEIQGILKMYNMPVDDDLHMQTFFYDELNKMFGDPATSGFSAEIAAGTKQGLEAAQAMTSPKAAILQKAAEKAGGKFAELRGVNEEAALDAILEILRR